MTKPMETMWSPKDSRYSFSHFSVKGRGYLVGSLQRLYLGLVALLVLQPQTVHVLLEEEGDAVVGQAEDQQVHSEEDAGGAQVDAAVLRLVVDGRAEVDIVHYMLNNRKPPTIPTNNTSNTKNTYHHKPNNNSSNSSITAFTCNTTS